MYIDACLDRKNDKIHVVERVDGKRVYREAPIPYRFYFADSAGDYTSVFGDKLTRVDFDRGREFHASREKRQESREKLFESDCNLVFRHLSEAYADCEPPILHVGFFDIEVDFDPERGFSMPEKPYAPVNAITIHMGWLDRLVTLAVPPAGMSWEDAQAVADQFDDTFMVRTERDLLIAFLDLIEDCDLLSGWNSTGYDLPYLVRRIETVLGDTFTRRLCLWGLAPKPKTYMKFKKEHETFELIGRVHMDYLELYEKNTFHEIHSKKLGYVGELEVGEKKTPYEGTLDQLYKQDFPKFIEYNRQDTMILVKMDRKLRFIDLANTLAHTNGILLQTTLGSVAMIDQAIINEIHHRDLIVFDKRGFTSQGKAAGAYVADPVKGLHDYVGAIDINSLYPSVIRALNMSPETLFGQLRQTYTDEFIAKKIGDGDESATDAWHDVFGSLEYQKVMERNTSDPIWVDLENDKPFETTGAEIHKWIFEAGQQLCLSANGTIFRTDIEGIIPGLLSRWYFERKDMQKKQKDAGRAAKEESDADKKKELEAESAFWAQRQLIRKILLNSLYGSILNEASRYFDPRIGQSVTLTGRCITKHMLSKTNQLLVGNYDHKGAAIVYGDTDSCYFSAATACKDQEIKALYEDFDWSKESVVELYDAVAAEVNTSFPAMMDRDFHCGLDRGEVIQAGRELVASKAMYIKKKRYAALIYDSEGTRVDTDGKPGKIKAMGVETQRSDTPEFVQKFLKEVLLKILTNTPETEIITYIRNFRMDTFRKLPPWQMGRPTAVNGITGYLTRQDTNAAKTQQLSFKLANSADLSIHMPGHIRASLNWNKMLHMMGDRYSLPVQDGSKIIVCDLRANQYNFASIARPVDQEEHMLPEWFKALPFDTKTMEEKLIDEKLENLIGILQWDLSKTRNDNTFGNFFKFEGQF